MQNDNLKRFFCFFLCFFLLISCIPRPAHAVGVEWILRQIATDIGITGILEGLGLFRDTFNGDEYYNELVSDVKDHLATTGQVAGDYIDAYWRIDPLNANPVLTIPLALITAVRSWIFDNWVVSYKPIVSGTSYEFSVGSYSGTCTTTAPTSLLVAYTEYRSGYECKLFAYSKENENFQAYNNGSTSWINSFQYGDYWVAQVSTFTTLSMSPSTLPLYHVASRDDYYSIFYSPIKSGVYSDNPVALGVISPPDTLFNVAYPQWLEHQRELEDGTMETVVQIGLGNTQAETESLTQEQIWSGLGTIQVPEQDQTEGTLLDILQAVVKLPTQIVGSIQTALQSFFQFSGQASDYAIQLRDFFPFCIPFDLFDFLTVLSAEPEAPVFHWEIPVPQLGQTFELEVDLSAWDDIAVLFRNLELLAFIFGLAIITREKFLRS